MSSRILEDKHVLVDSITGERTVFVRVEDCPTGCKKCNNDRGKCDPNECDTSTHAYNKEEQTCKSAFYFCASQYYHFITHVNRTVRVDWGRGFGRS